MFQLFHRYISFFVINQDNKKDYLILQTVQIKKNNNTCPWRHFNIKNALTWEMCCYNFFELNLSVQCINPRSEANFSSKCEL